MKELVRLEGLLDVMVQGDVGDVGDVFDVEELLCLLRAELGELHLLFLALDDIVPMQFLGLGELALPCLFAVLAGSACPLLGVLEIVVEAAVRVRTNLSTCS